MDKLNNFFITGMPRSGTTLLTYRFNLLRNTLALRENQLILRTLRDIKKNKVSNATLNFVKSKDMKGKKVGVYKSSFDHEALKEITNPIEFYNEITANIHYNGSSEITKNVIDKNPTFIWFGKELVNAFPNSKFILTIRDPRGFVLSRREKPNASNKIHNTSYLSYVARSYYKETMRFYHANKSKCILVKYETLTASPEKELKKICDFMNIEFNNSMIDEQDIPMPTTNLRASIRKADITQAINSNRAYSWKEKLTNRELRIVNSICENEIKLHGGEIQEKTIWKFPISRGIQRLSKYYLILKFKYFLR